MSRTGRKPIQLPEGVEFSKKDNVVTVKGPLGQLQREVPGIVNIDVEDNQIIVSRNSDSKVERSMHGLTRTLVANMVEGVTQGFSKTLELVGVGYRANKQGDTLVLSVGYSHPVNVTPPAGVQIEVPAPTKIIVKGIDKEAVGSLAANIRAYREPEPYKGKGIKYENERIRRKVGKTGK
ncbi:50S ribosomal protein L6 [Dethiobacter alkaliphilus]|uniref:Large ribosomal subunit protein uL6 n=1 Tax=Dethiobacter alkaliphilus AHT 1 TaxID=555088 RepID=C0GG99_DETAL|nr:50S ribosomal protein L6 [Dethiobacter alkaliphilus]EEG77788.1 ribosomal protein L6 [Dethiobacter alkaliphilus AHT 1]MCW3491098.1 50S ribosomal protein L6 [Dethiobacter alkaliphilus]